jgi:acetyl-CoA acetyltransferase
VAAIADAGLRPSDIDGVCGVPGATGLPGVSSGGIRGLEQALGLSPSWHCAGQEGSGAVVNAVLAVASGLCQHVLCFASTSSADRTSVVGSTEALSPDDQAALAASEYLARYHVGREALGWVAIAARRHAERNPDALRRTPIDMASYLSFDPVASPLGELDRGIRCDGAVALVISAVERAAHCSHRPVLLDAIGTRQSPSQFCDAGLAGYWQVAQQPAAHMWRRATIDREDVDFIAVNDAFTVDTLRWLEALGFCEPGDAARFVDGGRRIGPDGVLPVNPHGGHLTAGSTGLDNLHETVLQLRGHAEGRQIQNARVAVASSGGAESVSALLFTDR